MSQPVTWGPPRAERADAARNRRLLLATAREIIAREGADRLTMDGLAERAGLGGFGPARMPHVIRRPADRRSRAMRPAPLPSGSTPP